MFKVLDRKFISTMDYSGPNYNIVVGKYIFFFFLKNKFEIPFLSYILQ